jgi:hypothetical protein
MANINHARSCVKSVLTKYAEQRSNQEDVEVQLVFDSNNDHYQILCMGWDGYNNTPDRFIVAGNHAG